MHVDSETIHVDEEDQCWTCRFVRGGNNKLCPLIEALSTGVVVTQDHYEVLNCDFYQRRFEVVT